MSPFTPSLRATADVVDLFAEIAGALSIITERLVIVALHDRRVGFVGDEVEVSQATLGSVAEPR